MSKLQETAWPERRAEPAPRLRYVVAGIAGLSAAVLAHWLVPSPAFPGRALVVVADPASSTSVSLLKAAGDEAVSKPVVSRASTSLIAAGFPAPPPGLAERIGVVAGWDGFHASSGEARLAEEITSIVSAAPAEMPGTLAITTAARDAEPSARMATALAQALIAEHDGAITQARRQRETVAGERLGRLKGAATAARKRFHDLGGTDADPAELRAATAAQLAAAQARADILRAIMTSGSPPLSDRRDVSPSIDSLQTTYLDLSRQLARAQETLGERHTTVISLHEEVRRASANLTAEWKRLFKLADSELAMARDRARAAARAEATVNGRNAVGDARVVMQLADDQVARAERDLREVTDDERGYRLLTPAAVPVRTIGVPEWARLAIGMLAGLLAFFAASRFRELRERAAALRARPERSRLPVQEAPMPVGDLRTARAPVLPEETSGAHEAPRRRKRPVLLPKRRPDIDLLLGQLGEIEPAADTIPTVVLAASEPGLDTAPDALQLAHAATASGRRVLVVEAQLDRPRLAAQVDDEAEPIVVDLFGELRVAMPADRAEDAPWVAPVLPRGARIAAGLAANPDTVLIDDIVEAFDLLIVDCGQASEADAIGWGADIVVRVGTRVSARDDERLVDALAIPSAMLIGTFVSSRFVPSAPPEVSKPAQAPPTSWPRAAERSAKARVAAPARSAAVRSPSRRRRVITR